MRERDLGRGMYVEVWQRYVCRGIGRCIVPSIWQNYAWMQRYARERFTGDVEVCAREVYGGCRGMRERGLRGM